MHIICERTKLFVALYLTMCKAIHTQILQNECRNFITRAVINQLPKPTTVMNTLLSSFPVDLSNMYYISRLENLNDSECNLGDCWRTYNR